MGEIEVSSVTAFEFIWSTAVLDPEKSVTFYKPVGIPRGFHILGHYCQPSDKPLRGFLLVAKETGIQFPKTTEEKLPALRNPLDFTLVWCSNAPSSLEISSGCGYFWLPKPPQGYKAVGYLVTDTPEKPNLDKISCVRSDRTDKCEPHRVTFAVTTGIPGSSFKLWSSRPSDRGMLGKGVSVGSFLCSSGLSIEQESPIACLKNINTVLQSMPNLLQVHRLINHYGPTVFFHPDEIYLPSSVEWYFSNGALLYRKDMPTGKEIDATGSSLPSGGSNDGEFWIDLPIDDLKDYIQHGNLESAKLYVHVKPALGGTFTDIAMWLFCPFNGPATLKFPMIDIPLGCIGEHVGDWEHITLRICNFAGELYSIYFSQHSGGEWIDACDLDYVEGNKAAVYSSKNGHASYPRPGIYVQGSSSIGIGIRNDAVRSNLYVDSSIYYEIVAAEYLQNAIVEPDWLQFRRKWGPSITYDPKTALDNFINAFPSMFQDSMRGWINMLPAELFGEEGPTGPKEKDNWIHDERWRHHDKVSGCF